MDVLSTDMNGYFSTARQLGHAKQLKNEAEMVYMYWFNKTMCAFVYGDIISTQLRYQIPSAWEGDMQVAITKGFDYDMLEKYTVFHREQVYRIDCEIALHPMICKKQMYVPTEYTQRRLAFYTHSALSLKTLYKHIDAHRTMIIRLNINKQAMRRSIEQTSEIHREHAMY